MNPQQQQQQQQQQNFPVQSVSHPSMMSAGASTSSIGSASGAHTSTGTSSGIATGSGVCRLCTSTSHGKSSSGEKTDAERIMCAVDKIAIQEIMSRYYYYFDTQNVEGWLSLWANQGEFRTNRSRASGMDELRQLITGHLRRSSGSRHACMNVIVDMKGDCCATARSLMVMFDGKQPPAKVLASALCEWEFCKAKESNEWKICRHAFDLDPSWMP